MFFWSARCSGAVLLLPAHVATRWENNMVLERKWRGYGYASAMRVPRLSAPNPMLVFRSGLGQ